MSSKEAGALDPLSSKMPTRAELEAQIENLIELLDQVDGDPDLEPAGDEADISWAEGMMQGRVMRVADPDPDAEDDGTSEPTLGAPEQHPSPPWGIAPLWRSRDGRQTNWAAGSYHQDGEAEQVNEDGGDVNDEGEADNGDLEPSLGWTGAFNQADAQRLGHPYFSMDQEGDEAEAGI